MSERQVGRAPGLLSAGKSSGKSGRIRKTCWSQGGGGAQAPRGRTSSRGKWLCGRPSPAPRPPARGLPLSWGRGCSSAWMPWLRNCDEPWERFCLSALRTDFRVKPSTFSEAEMAAPAAPAAGGDDDDISAALPLGSSGCCLHGTGSGGRRRRAGGKRGAVAPLRPVLPGLTAFPLPGAAELLLAPRRRLTAASQRWRFLVPAARRAPGAGGGKGGGGGGRRSC